MDGTQFDIVARAFAAMSTRRQALGFLGGLGLAGLLGAIGD